jgi:YHS domain-containing protein
LTGDGRIGNRRYRNSLTALWSVQKDPVCGMMVDETKTKLKSEHDGRTFFFCSASCLGEFEKNPHKYAHG